jgi:hypothetical protein
MAWRARAEEENAMLRTGMVIASLAAVVLLNGALATLEGRDKVEANMPSLNLPDKLEWRDGPPSLPAGAKIAVLEGDPSKEGPFVFRLKLPDGYRVPPHTHPKTERVTVISGTFNIGMGDRFDEKATEAMPAGTYGYWQAGMHHFVWTKGGTVLQFHGTGPWSIQYVDPRDDPRKQQPSSDRPGP